MQIPTKPCPENMVKALRAMETGGGWEWDDASSPKSVTCEWVLPCE